MELEKIREFTAFARTLKFTDAAQALHMSQSSLSKHIRDLEEELGMLLVERGAAGTGKNALTPAGRRYLELAGAWLDEHDAIVAECRLIADELPPARIHDVHCSFNVNAQLRRALEAEDVRALTLEEFVPVVYPFLVYRRDTASVVARRIVEAFAENGKTGNGCAG